MLICYMAIDNVLESSLKVISHVKKSIKISAYPPPPPHTQKLYNINIQTADSRMRPWVKNLALLLIDWLLTDASTVDR